MSIDDHADPGRTAALCREIRNLARDADHRRTTAKEVDALLKRIRYHRNLLDDGEGNSAHHCRRINEALESLLALGVPPSDRRLRKVRRRLDLGAFPPEVPPHEALLRADPMPEPGDDVTDADDDSDESDRWSDRVERVRKLLAGRTIVVVGGDPRPLSVARIERAFAPSRVEWVDLVEHGPGEPMRAPIARAETGLVAILVKLAGHHHVDEARTLAIEGGKAVVMLPAGYNPEQIAAQVLDQTSARLAGPVANAE